MSAGSVLAGVLALAVGLLLWRARASRVEAAAATARLAAILESFSAGSRRGVRTDASRRATAGSASSIRRSS